MYTISRATFVWFNNARVLLLFSRLKIELVGCVKNATEDCNDASLLELAENVSGDLFDYLYKTDDCDQGKFML